MNAKDPGQGNTSARTRPYGAAEAANTLTDLRKNENPESFSAKCGANLELLAREKGYAVASTSK